MNNHRIELLLEFGLFLFGLTISSLIADRNGDFYAYFVSFISLFIIVSLIPKTRKKLDPEGFFPIKIECISNAYIIVIMAFSSFIISILISILMKNSFIIQAHPSSIFFIFFFLFILFEKK